MLANVVWSSHASDGSRLAFLAAAALPSKLDQLSQTQLQPTSHGVEVNGQPAIERPAHLGGCSWRGDLAVRLILLPKGSGPGTRRLALWGYPCKHAGR